MFAVDPQFNKKITKINADGIIYTRLVNLIITAVVILTNYSKAKKLIEGYKPEIADNKNINYN